MLLDKGFAPELAHQVFRLIDWMMALPPEIERRFREKIVELKENPKMRYVTSFERIVRQEGREEGLEDGLRQGLEDGLRQGREQGRKGQAALIHRLLELRFGELSSEQLTLLEAADLRQLSRWGERVVTAATLGEVFAAE